MLTKASLTQERRAYIRSEITKVEHQIREANRIGRNRLELGSMHLDLTMAKEACADILGPDIKATFKDYVIIFEW
jgi:hypothetical protein